jgi:hypothetical protein
VLFLQICQKYGVPYKVGDSRLISPRAVACFMRSFSLTFVLHASYWFAIKSHAELLARCTLDGSIFD